MALWKLFEYVDANGKNWCGDWYNEQDPAVQAAFDSTWYILRSKPKEGWTDRDVEEFKVLTNRNQGLGEIRFQYVVQSKGKDHKRRFRPVGPWPTNGNNFVILRGCEKHHKGTYIPAGAFDLAQKQAADLAKGKGSIRERI